MYLVPIIVVIFIILTSDLEIRINYKLLSSHGRFSLNTTINES